MANHMPEVANMLGVELKERFKIIDEIGIESDNYYYFTNEGLVTYNGYLQEDILLNLILGHFRIKDKPWKPSKGDKYWYISSNGSADYYCWTDDTTDFLTYKLGNCYKTAQEAEDNRDKWVTFYASDEVLEV